MILTILDYLEPFEQSSYHEVKLYTDKSPLVFGASPMPAEISPRRKVKHDVVDFEEEEQYWPESTTQQRENAYINDEYWPSTEGIYIKQNNIEDFKWHENENSYKKN